METTWIVLADEGRARILATRAPGTDLAEVEEMTDAAAHADNADLRRDAYGRRAGPDQRMGGSAVSSAGEEKLDHEAELFARRIAGGLGHTLVAPVIAYVPEGAVRPPTAHMRFPGTITIPDAAFESTLEYTARSFRQHGFRHIVLIGDHGGYQKNMKRVADKLNREWASEATRVHALEDYYRAFDAEYTRLLKSKGYKDEEIGTHAALADTSLAMAVDPRLVRSERLRGSKLGPAEGVYGDPARSNAEAGQLGADLIVGRTIEAIRREWSRR